MEIFYCYDHEKYANVAMLFNQEINCPRIILPPEDRNLANSTQEFSNKNDGRSLPKRIPQKSVIICKTDKDIHIDKDLTLSRGDYYFITSGNIIFHKGATLYKEEEGGLYLKAGIENSNGKIIFEDINEKQIIATKSSVNLYYHPESNTDDRHYSHKYHNPASYSQHITSKADVTSYMLISNLKDLQDIKYNMGGNYALSNNIDCESNFLSPLINYQYSQPTPFSGNFDGNDFTIKNINIDSNKNFVGIFGLLVGPDKGGHNIFQNINFDNVVVKGTKYTGVLAGFAECYDISNVGLYNISVIAEEMAGGLIGTVQNSSIHAVIAENVTVQGVECTGKVVGAFDYRDQDDNILQFQETSVCTHNSSLEE